MKWPEETIFVRRCVEKVLKLTLGIGNPCVRNASDTILLFQLSDVARIQDSSRVRLNRFCGGAPTEFPVPATTTNSSSNRTSTSQVVEKGIFHLRVSAQPLQNEIQISVPQLSRVPVKFLIEHIQHDAWILAGETLNHRREYCCYCFRAAEF